MSVVERWSSVLHIRSIDKKLFEILLCYLSFPLLVHIVDGSYKYPSTRNLARATLSYAPSGAARIGPVYRVLAMLRKVRLQKSRPEG